MEKSKKLSLLQFIGITMAFFGSVRSIPTLSINGWSQVSYLIGAVVIFAIPISLISAELATTYPKEGGPQVWVKEAFGEKFGFVTSWLLWVQMFFGMVMISSTIGVMLAYAINKPELAHNSLFVFACIIIGYWLVTILNLKFDMTKIVGNWGAWVGVYIPFILLVGFGIAYFIKFGIQPDSYLGGAFTASRLLPDFSDMGTLTYFSGIIFIFAGIEISSVHANNIENPKRNYPIAIIATLIIIVILNLITGLAISNAVPMGKIELSNIIQPFVIFFTAFGIPVQFAYLVAAMICIGVLAQLSAWVLGPSKAMIKVAEEGLLPPVFQKRNKRGIPVTFVLIQAIVISLIGFVYVVIPNVDTAFLIITITTTILYCLAYVLMVTAVIKLRYKKPNMERPFKLGSNGVLWCFVILALVGIGTTIFASLVPPSILPQNEHAGYIAFQIIASAVFFFIPFGIYKFKKDSWKKEEK